MRVMQAFSDEPNDDARKAMVTDLPTKEPGQATARMRDGSRSAAELYVAYGMDCSEQSRKDPTRAAVSYAKFEQAQAQQRLRGARRKTASPANKISPLVRKKKRKLYITSLLLRR
jgi:hypothetical protein